jgi:hypothetical protein
MSAAELYAELEEQGVFLSPSSDGKRIDVDAPDDAPESTFDLIAEHKQALLAHLEADESRRLSATERVMLCRNSEDLIIDAHWCRRCWRYKLAGCHPTQKRLVRKYVVPDERSQRTGWFTDGDSGLVLEEVAALA